MTAYVYANMARGSRLLLAYPQCGNVKAVLAVHDGGEWKKSIGATVAHRWW